MKKLLLFFLFATLYLGTSTAQEVRFGATTGLNLSSPSKMDGSKIGFNIGAKGELLFRNDMFLEFGLSLSSKGWESQGYYDQEKNEGTKWKSTPYYLDIPIRFGHKLKLRDNLKLIGSVGPYVGVGLWGKCNSTIKTKDKTVTTTASKNVFKDKIQQRFDWGLGVNLGVELHEHYQISLGYNLGLKNLSKVGNVKNRVLNVSFAYMF